mmetsp:Transcript_11568/g.25365  ORF Transcript_11568/g.25365 Transcript_11568/m.25365 type:complete len:210 (+) Transcript_11568:525-1154(+)
MALKPQQKSTPFFEVAASARNSAESPSLIAHNTRNGNSATGYADSPKPKMNIPKINGQGHCRRGGFVTCVRSCCHHHLPKRSKKYTRRARSSLAKWRLMMMMTLLQGSRLLSRLEKKSLIMSCPQISHEIKMVKLLLAASDHACVATHLYAASCCGDGRVSGSPNTSTTSICLTASNQIHPWESTLLPTGRPYCVIWVTAQMKRKSHVQ